MGIKARLDAPVSLVFSIICIVVFALDCFLLKGKVITTVFTCPGNSKAAVPFNFASPLNYIKLFTHIFGAVSWSSLLINLSFILLVGPVLEERYGSPIVALAITMVALLTGVLNACCVSLPLTGSTAIVFLMLLLASVASLDKKELPLSFVLVFLLYLSYEFYISVKASSIAAGTSNTFIRFLNANLQTFISLAGGVCGSLFGFLVAPKKPRTKKASSSSDEETVVEAKPEKKSWFNKKNKPAPSDSSGSDSTYLGEIKL